MADKGKRVSSDVRENVVLKRATEDEHVEDSKRAKESLVTHHQKTGETIHSPRGATQTSIPALHSWTEQINIGSRQDELDPAILEKLPSSSAIAAASVHKYWTST
ncbi:hypothetical protein Fot_42085 [Forsythia ovata]|uniref:Uncharacterized protein n=1 Tax=Forsythia ovata TaxID=205694 RepID=A0ABD1RK60_9LAMI